MMNKPVKLATLEKKMKKVMVVMVALNLMGASVYSREPREPREPRESHSSRSINDNAGYRAGWRTNKSTHQHFNIHNDGG
jgi:hypothetical protein